MIVSELFNKLKGETLYYKPNPGNGGDALTAAGEFKLFDDHNLDIKFITDEEYSYLDGKIVMYAGGGNLVKEYNNCATFISKVHDRVKELIVLPHTVNGHEELHDLAFHLDASSYDLKHMLTKSNALYLKQKVINVFTKSKSSVLNAYRMDVEKTDMEIPPNNIDVSIKINHSSKMYPKSIVHKTTRDIFQFLNKYDSINTNRLHIAVACALIGKKVNMYGNSYYKNEAIYNYSLKDKYPNVKFCK